MARALTSGARASAAGRSTRVAAWVIGSAVAGIEAGATSVEWAAKSLVRTDLDAVVPWSPHQGSYWQLDAVTTSDS